MKYCSSCRWEHSRDTALDEPGFYTCAEHRVEEEYIRRVIQELEEVEKEVDCYANTPQPHPDEAKALDITIQWFFNLELKAFDLECSSGFRERPGSVNEELDVVVAVEPNVPEWSANAKIYRNSGGIDLALHMEVAYRSKASSELSRKARDMVKKINKTIDTHIKREAPLPWTGIVLLGDGWIGKQSEVVRRVCKQYHSRNVQRVTLRNQDFWPYLDAIVLPSIMYKKHDLFLTEQLTGERWPALVPMPCGAHVLRPLATARGFLVHRVKVLRGECQPESAAWPINKYTAILGPDILSQEYKEESFCMRDCPAKIKQLWHKGNLPDSKSNRSIPMSLRILDTDESDPARYRLRFDAERSKQLIQENT